MISILWMNIYSTEQYNQPSAPPSSGCSILYFRYTQAPRPGLTGISGSGDRWVKNTPLAMEAYVIGVSPPLNQDVSPSFSRQMVRCSGLNGKARARRIDAAKRQFVARVALKARDRQRGNVKLMVYGSVYFA